MNTACRNPAVDGGSINDNIVRVRIQATYFCSYDQIVEISLDKWEELKQTSVADMLDWQQSPLEALLRDPVADSMGWSSAQLEVLGDDDEPQIPAYGWNSDEKKEDDE